MNRRENLAILGQLPLAAGMVLAAEDKPGETPPFWKSRLSDVEATVGQVARGRARVLARSPGNRPIYVVAYGEPFARGKATANYNSACGGASPASYAPEKDGTQRPVVFLLGPVHGGEFEGVVGLVNLIRVAETGDDWRRRPWPELAANLARCRVLVVPSGNPDGRARCPRDSYVGIELAECERVDMGTKPDGSSYHWPEVKRIHPMRGQAVGTLGAYFNDDGVNLMHDEWFDPMAAETRAFFRVAREEAPDFVVSLHSHASAPSIEPSAYVPRAVKEIIQQIGDRVQRRYAGAGLPHRNGGPVPAEDGANFPPPSFNLSSALHHACGGVSFVYECCTGTRTAPYPAATHDQILDLQLMFFDELFRYAVEHPIRFLT
jgi:Zinc carboxypeptidase